MTIRITVKTAWGKARTDESGGWGQCLMQAMLDGDSA
ncbi:hypothetical protein CBFG_01457 [Clostridiales bacterium 1_7_47FAA]|nr:hypothetical protein CBFG_01457 [Clostridiales bacterium 1_7_47FAA]